MRQEVGIGKVVSEKPPGRTLCRDGAFSTLPHGPGVCSYHGGSVLTVRQKPAPDGIAPMPKQSKPAPFIAPDTSRAAYEGRCQKTNAVCRQLDDEYRAIYRIASDKNLLEFSTCTTPANKRSPKHHLRCILDDANTGILTLVKKGSISKPGAQGTINHIKKQLAQARQIIADLQAPAPAPTPAPITVQVDALTAARILREKSGRIETPYEFTIEGQTVKIFHEVTGSHLADIDLRTKQAIPMRPGAEKAVQAFIKKMAATQAIVTQKLEKQKAVKVKDAGTPIVQLVPLQAIAIRRDWFQNRATPYSERSVQNIMDAVQAGQFKWVNLDPVVLWAHGGKLYMLSGHSRLEAFERLCKMGARVDGRDFCHIPAKIDANLTLEEAKQVALQSNTLSTKETEIERAEYYSKLRSGGTPEAKIKEEAKRLEGQNWTTVYAISNLNPMGKTMNAIRALDKADATSRSNAFTIARWIGNARAAVKSLTNFHEDEIYSWLVMGKGYGTKPGQINNERDFSARLTSIINRRTEFGVLAESLNIQSNITLSPVERQYREELQQATQTVKDLQKQIDQKIAEYRARGASEAEIIQLTQGLQATLTRARIAYQNLMLKKSDISQYARQERGLFDELAGIRRRYYPTPRFHSQHCNYYL